jgi:hypothetical protein
VALCPVIETKLFIGRPFVQATMLDPKQHWATSTLTPVAPVAPVGAPHPATTCGFGWYLDAAI